MTGNEKYVYNLTGTVYIHVHNMYSVHTHVHVYILKIWKKL